MIFDESLGAAFPEWPSIRPELAKLTCFEPDSNHSRSGVERGEFKLRPLSHIPFSPIRCDALDLSGKFRLRQLRDNRSKLLEYLVHTL